LERSVAEPLERNLAKLSEHLPVRLRDSMRHQLLANWRIGVQRRAATYRIAT
jgi:hypothetical protein